MISVSGCSTKYSPVFTFTVFIIHMAWISTITSFCNSPIGKMTGRLASRTKSSPVNSNTLFAAVSHPLLLKFSSGLALYFHSCILPGVAVIALVIVYRFGSSRSCSKTSPALQPFIPPLSSMK